MHPIEIEAKDRDDAIDQLGEMVMPDPCGLFEVEEVKKNDWVGRSVYWIHIKTNGRK